MTIEAAPRGDVDSHRQTQDWIMMLAQAAILGMPCLLMTICIAVSRYLKEYPGKDDVWDLPKVSSLR